jgi:hypothetical protein
MPSTYSSSLKIELIATGEQTGTWGATTNTNLGTAIEEAITGVGSVVYSSDANQTLSFVNNNATQIFRNLVLNITSSLPLTQTRELVVPTIEKQYLVWNNTTGSQSITVKTAAGTGVTVPNGARVHLVVDGTNVINAVTVLNGSITGNAATATALQTARTIGGVSFDGTANINLPGVNQAGTQNTSGVAANVSGTVAIANGGTGATSASAARTALGATTVGANLFTLGDPSAIRFLRLNADNTVSALSDSDFRTAIGAGTGSGGGTVTSVAVSGGTTGLTISGSPITTSGTITLAGTLAVANGGTGATTASAARTSFGATTVGANLFTLTDPSAVRFLRVNADNTVSSLSADDFRVAIGAGTGTGGGTVTSVAVSGGTTGLTVSGSPITSSGTITLSGTLNVANGGTGATTASAARTALGASTVGANLFTLSNPSAITFLRINADNTTSALSASDFRTAIGVGSGSGTVTSVSGTGSVSGITLSGTVTTSGNISLGGTLSVSASNFSSQVAKTFLAAPNASSGTPTFRTIVASDIPTLNQSTTGNAATASTLQTARTINGTSFNGGSNITTANWGTSRTLTIGSTGKSVNGSGDVSWSLSEIGAAAAIGVSLRNATTTLNTTYADQVVYSDDGTAYTYTLDNSVAIGTHFSIQNRGSGAKNITVAAGSGNTLYWLQGTASAPGTGSRTISRGGVMTVVKIASTVFHCYGGGIA